VAVLAVATVAIGVLAISAAASSFSYYATPEEFAQQIEDGGGRWRVGGRVVDGSVIEENGRPVQWVIEGESGESMTIRYDGIVPALFGPRAFVVVEGTAEGPGALDASSVIIRHEPEFVTDADDASIAPPDE
jgi:cytochrome c-type biogenesis protein CcmE